jgi:hypothetical protein
MRAIRASPVLAASLELIVNGRAITPQFERNLLQPKAAQQSALNQVSFV